MWWALIKQYWQVCIFKRTPEKTPYSPLLLIIVSLSYLLLLAIQWEIVDFKQQFSWLATVSAAVCLIFSYSIYTFFLLYALKLKNRFIKTLTCLYSCHLIVHVLAFPLILLTPYLQADILNQSMVVLLGIIYLLAALSLTFWQFMLAVYIYKYALSAHYFAAVLASFGLLATNMILVSFWR